MQLVPYRDVTIENGLEGDCRGRGGLTRKRQITVLSEEQWGEACQELGARLPWQMRRANLHVKGLRFGLESAGRYLRIGPHVVLEITDETDPCKRMEEAHPGLKTALVPDWRGGVTCRVIDEGSIMIGHEVHLI